MHLFHREATAIFDYDTENIDEHCFKDGDRMYVKEAPEDPGWYVANLKLIPVPRCRGILKLHKTLETDPVLPQCHRYWSILVALGSNGQENVRLVPSTHVTLDDV